MIEIVYHDAAHDGLFHTVRLLDEDVTFFAELFLPPAGSYISAEDLEGACQRLHDMTCAWRRLCERGVES